LSNREKVVDEIAGSGLFIVQSPTGVKASVDGILLARFAGPLPGWKVADLGCGNGLVGLVIAHDNPQCSVLGIEIQKELVHQASEGAGLSGLSNVDFLCADMKTPSWKQTPGIYDLVVANPPYYKLGSGRLSPDPARAGARHEIFGTVVDFARAASSLLKDGGRSTWIYLPERMDDLVDAVKEYGMEPTRVRKVHSRRDDPPAFILMEAINGSTATDIIEEPPLILYREGEGRDYTDEARLILYGV
jgi:tRNA1Val (adenine37-N6)-methyltransferase